MANGTQNRRAILFIPPGGFAGFAQQTAATQALLGNGRRNGTAPKRRTRKKTAKRRPAAAKKRAAPKRRAGGRARLVKGSAAAKRHMANLRKMRRK